MTLSVCARRVHGGKYMPEDWIPTKNDVIIGRGKRVVHHAGNQKLRALVQQEVELYSCAKNRAAKSVIIIRVFKAIRADTEIGFVKKDPSTKKFYAVEDTAAKITIAQYFRDALADGYKSSKQYKQKLRDALKRSVSDVGQGGAPMGHFSSHVALKRSASAGDPYHASLPMSCNVFEEPVHQASSSHFLKMARTRCNPPMVHNILQSASDLLEDDGDCSWPTMGEETNVRISAQQSSDDTALSKEAFANLYRNFASNTDKTSDPFEPTPLKEASSPMTVDKVESSPFHFSMNDAFACEGNEEDTGPMAAV